MGQQQLLLLILAAVIVGVAIVLGVNMFAQNSAQANQEAVTQDVLTIASRAQAWYRRPTQMGGGGRTYAGMTLTDLNFPASNANGTYAVGTGTATTIQITGNGVEDPDGDGTPLSVVVTVGVDTVSAATVTQ
jgi:type II secretory pathway pseudopilin PulG